ncbi:SgcJ/EcaC family oxidoreductase [Micromonospora sp. 4G55]|uniref:SgcJ/EcaC family oxidoreductase n=1 Tax=Micromonospora sp. 4G55 TaxID=2806102 RepID=UPI001A57963D|nr:SgcJ/EcaC family oxidoreductase [Micromonospora sp. 4G55]MBM0259431.1 SgcJ/EcaC family oxidoreductase [Micromonospora sp. 4G55]
MNKKLRYALVGTALALAVTAGAGYAWLANTSEVRNTGTTNCADLKPTGGTAEDHRAVCDLMDGLIEAWDRNDADAYGALFTEDATYTTYVGTHYDGRRDITEGHRALFGGFVKDTRLASSWLGMRFLSADAAVVTGRGDTFTGSRPDDLGKVQTYTVVRDADGAWRIAAFHNTQRQSVMERISFLLSPGTAPEAER